MTIVAAGPFMFVVHPSLPVRNLKESIALAKAHPGKLAFGAAGAGSVSHLGIEMLKSMAKVDFVQFAERIRQDLPRWGKVVSAAGIRPE